MDANPISGRRPDPAEGNRSNTEPGTRNDDPAPSVGSRCDCPDLEAEDRLRHVRETQAVAALAGGIAHEFNNILGAITGYAQMGIQKARQGSDLGRYFEQVLEAGMRGQELVRQILILSRRTDREHTPVELPLILKEALKRLKASLPATIDIQRILSGKGLVRGDPAQLHQVVMSLCAHAVRAIPGTGGVLHVSLTDEFVDGTGASARGVPASGWWTRFTVRGAGTGMEFDAVERVVEQQVRTKRPGKDMRMPLGFGVIRGVVETLGGVLLSRPEPGGGLSISVLLPTTTEPAVEQPEGETLLPGGTERILLVDDEEILVDLAKEIFENRGYRVVGANTGQEALEIFQARPGAFDLVVTDQIMPGMTGVELAGELRRTRQRIPVILCTGFIETITADVAGSVGIREILFKPVPEAVLMNTVRRVLDET